MDEEYGGASGCSGGNCVCCGRGGWGVYSRVQPAQSPKVIAMPQRVNTPGGFSNAGAMRTPQTLNGPVSCSSCGRNAKQNGDVKVVPMPKKSQGEKTTAHKKAPAKAHPR
jgi:hypothetical protein